MTHSIVINTIDRLKKQKKAFCLEFNAIFGKIGHIASENVINELLKSTCIHPRSVLCLEACPVNKSLVKSIQFAINSCFSKIFQIKDSLFILECVTVFNKCHQRTTGEIS